ncbi:MAG: Gfo/Idh/MocA family protein, partial [Actinomycetes bacterium]
MRLAVVGVGRIGAAHAQVVRDHPEVDDVVLVDADRTRAAKVAEELGVTAGGTLEDELPAVDGLLVTANTAAHPDLIIAGVRAGVPVFCEKPVATDVTGTRAVLQEV